MSSIRFFRFFDWISFGLIVAIACIGLLFIFSTTYTPEQPLSIFFKKQACGLIIAIGIYMICCFSEDQTFMRWGYVGYFGVIGLLIFTLIKGSIGMGAQRWIDLFIIKVQPAELAKLLFPAFTAYHFYTLKNEHIITFKNFVPVLIMLGLSFVLILKQPDLGTALIILCSGCIMLWLAGITKTFFIYSALIITIASPLLWYTLKPYQKNRIAVFLGYGDKHKDRYQIEQSTIAIGSGGFLGKGFLNGTQNTLRFLPESRTDFIFAIMCEEWGFLGALLVLFLYAVLFVRLFWTIQLIRAPDIQLLAAGIIMHIIFSTLINIGMVINMLPIVGIPLPLMSYGLSNLWIVFASLGWFASIRMRRLYKGEMKSFSK